MSGIIFFAALIIGSIIGFSFGFIQKKAYDRYERKQRNGTFRSAWSIMPGSGMRIAYLMIVLFIIQVTCPLFFNGNIEWIVSAGVVLGYGWILVQQLKTRSRSITQSLL